MATSISFGDSLGRRQAAPLQEATGSAPNETGSSGGHTGGRALEGRALEGRAPDGRALDARASGARAPILFMGRRSTAAALVAGALLNAAASFLNTAFLQGEATAAGYTEAFFERGSLGMLGVLLNIVGIPLMLAGIVGLMQLASPNAPIVSRIAVAATTVGMVAFLCMNGALVALYSFGSGGAAAAGSAAEQLAVASPGMLALLVPFLLGNAVGLICTAIALLKSRVTALWVPAVLLVFFVLDFLVPSIAFFDVHLLFVAFAVGAGASVLRRRRPQLFPQQRP